MRFLVVFFASVLVATTSASKLPSSPNLPVRFKDLSRAIHIGGRIVNGNDAAPNQFPYQAGLSFSGKKDEVWWCGGSLIGTEYILTAAHCTASAKQVDVYLGSTLREESKVHYTVKRANFIQHKKYDDTTLENDISLIIIPAVVESDSIRIVALPPIASSYSSYTGKEAVASGWGVDNSGEIASKLQYTNMKVISNFNCQRSFGEMIVYPENICTSGSNKVSICQGDSGGPLLDLESQVLIGVTSFTSPDGCSAGRPQGFTRVTSFLDWIKENSGISY